ncbi:MAG TPA: rRNA maturation RNase YbeY [Thermoanaerobaculia bacterium]|jgi:probable rRNA maturation factor|nr:rRNA maturation RNase YbeY [Thermoanaerobaculia bacterium]
MNVEVTGSVPRFSQREIAAFARTVLLTLEKLDRLDRDVSEVSIALVDDEAMRSLNRKFRHKNKTTDVLTFPADDSYADPAAAHARPLGDIVISVDQARKQAADERHSVATEVRYLILHGILHALGYDHETDSGEMNALEVEIREAVGLS